MKIIVNNHFTLSSPDDVYEQFQTPVWEIEIHDPVLDTQEFEQEMHDSNNFVISEWHRKDLRSIYNGSGVVANCLAESQQEFLLELVSRSPCFRPRYHSSLDQYRTRTGWFATVLRDQPGFKMAPHLDNSHVMVQMVVNLVQHNTTATEFYYFNETAPCYRAPLKKNHGVIFLNTPGSVHGITNVHNTRWTLSGGLRI
jgi:hypothetical protein